MRGNREQRATPGRDCLEKLLKLLFQEFIFCVTTFSALHICFFPFFEFKTGSLTRYCDLVVDLRSCFVLLGCVTGLGHDSPMFPSIFSANFL